VEKLLHYNIDKTRKVLIDDPLKVMMKLLIYNYTSTHVAYLGQGLSKFRNYPTQLWELKC